MGTWLLQVAGDVHSDPAVVCMSASSPTPMLNLHTATPTAGDGIGGGVLESAQVMKAGPPCMGLVSF